MLNTEDDQFGTSEGIVLFRGVAAHLGTVTEKIRAPGGTRKVAYLTKTPGNLLENFETYVGGLWARVRWKQEGHGSEAKRETPIQNIRNI